MKSKSDGLGMETHSKSVYDVSKVLVEQLPIDMNDFELISNSIFLSSLLHDIGKLTTVFQKYLTDDIKTNLKFRHNEIGWAFFNNIVKFDDKMLSDFVGDSIYWHHGISNKFNENLKSCDILENLGKNKDADIENMIRYFENIIIKYFPNIKYEINIDNEICGKTPKYYTLDDDVFYNGINYNHRKINSLKQIIRSAVVMADRISSDNEFNLKYINNDIDIKKYVCDFLMMKNNVFIDKNQYSDVSRFNKQIEIVNNIHKTTIVKAPAGFGKTLIGLLWCANSNKKLIWVCPRNFVVDSVYNSVLNELDKNKCNVTIQKFVSGEIQDANHNCCDPFESDITITNIDNFLAPTTDNSKMNYMYLINSCNLVFDEYHELIGDSALFSAFVNIMFLRNYVSKK